MNYIYFIMHHSELLYYTHFLSRFGYGALLFHLPLAGDV